jgi:lysine-N-methylase
MNKAKVYAPEYFKKFKCTCGNCSSNCCSHNWSVDIDKITYDKYMALDESDRDELKKRIKIVTEEPFFAVLLPNNDGKCPYLDDMGFCALQLKYGYNFLSRTCRLHPRSISYIAGEFEIFLELACEEAVRVVLFDKNIMKFEEVQFEPDEDGTIWPNHIFKQEQYISATDTAGIFWRLRIVCLTIAQSRQYSVRFRLLILCLFIEQLNNLLSDGKDTQLLTLADEYQTALDTGVYDSLAEQMPGGVECDFGLVLEVLSDMETKKDERFNKSLKKVLKGLGITPNIHDLPSDFSEKYKKYYQQYFANQEHIFENFIVNHILMMGFPFNFKNEAGDVMQNYAELLAKFNLIEFLLTGTCKYDKKLNKRSIIECVSAFCRKYDHSVKGYMMMG